MSVAAIAQENTILVVDDTPTNLQVLFDLLSEQGYRVAIAKNGETALQRQGYFILNKSLSMLRPKPARR
ncbi:MAG: hypothetical protein KME15_23480 [Drouetiella hepatica Uher 2000/2452]|jgi:response regulator RpfG family c-di-GMP phosphodiesterase|uniref:Response regulatory domain-containing protein n=1 Tax=Drouetiella hepatica Uher 2000/2452 TaxID=904376 RepID=A0A951UPN0_9CYAN|nr:hypothetical protein [Drouetiella hepatica Uher 2000/2452]